ncbi:hypothetical protein [Rhodobaculum claviforme]|uniref:Baseplate protein J-like domain-containing protein n=1 Tax=Rhodobaculum claviforme TaxID=1549854 RepID=A0A934WHT3_9RHOB|nr:hypothetical protein [Rhodobaculum claviforme]MBK5926174.1 hypothetical protein [Rhodobaculum claviforme]
MTPAGARRSYQQIVEAMLEDLRAGGVLTDVAPGSVARTLVEATAREFAELHARMQAVYDAGFIDTAEGASLDQLVAMLGLERLSGDAATLELRARRDSRISARVIVPRGAQVAVELVRGGRAIYRVSDSFEIAEGEAARVLTLQAAAPVDGDLDDVAVTADDVAGGQARFLRPIAGVAGLEFTAPSVTLAARESDAALRERARMAIAAAGGGTEKALTEALLAIDEIHGVKLRDAGDSSDGPPLRPGELEIALDADPADVERNLDRIRAAIEGAKGPGIVARLARTGRKALGGRLLIRPAGPPATAEEALALVSACEAVVAETVAGLAIGEGLVWNRLLTRLMGVDGVADVLVGASRFRVGGDEVPVGDVSVTASERLVLSREGGVAVALEDKPVLTLALILRFDAGTPAEDEATRARAEVTAALGRYVETLKGGAVLGIGGLYDALRGEDGITAFADALSRDGLTLLVVDSREGTELSLRDAGTEDLDIPDGALLRLRPEPVTLRWEEGT